MDECFRQRCVTSDASAGPDAATPQWLSAGRCELALVKEPRGAHGASRAVLASIVDMVAECRKTAKVLLITLDSPASQCKSSKVSTIDYSNDTMLFQQLLDEDSGSQLLDKLGADVDAFVAGYNPSNPADGLSSRPLVIVLDSLNALLQYQSLAQVLFFLKKLQSRPHVGSVIARLNASIESRAATLALATAATAIVSVETSSSLRAYPLLAKERQREIPKAMDGLVQLVRHKKNGRTSDSIEYFQLRGGSVVYFDRDEAQNQGEKPQAVPAPTVKKAEPIGTHNAGAITHESETRTDQPPLPVAQDDVSFRLTMSAQEQLAKSKVQLPYMHQGSALPAPAEPAAATNLFFIDEDDPDWDDDDLDDDLDI